MNFFLLLLLIITFSSCLLAESLTSNDYSAFMAFKSHLILKKDSILFTNWSSNAHVCKWYGVSCLNNRVINLQLPGMGLQGTISSDIGNLTELVELDLSSNELGGFLPNELGFLQKLRLFNVTENLIHGIIPGNISRCQKLEELYISENFITGSIPQELGDLANLKALRLNDNNLTGKIPVSLDFGIAKIFAQDQHVAQTMTLGTIGYIAPEYGVDGKISTKNDVYSFGILLLETFTGKRPTDPLFVEGDLDLQKWVTRSFPDALTDVLDTKLRNDVCHSREAINTDRKNKRDKALSSIINVGLMCLKESPEERVTMREVVLQLKKFHMEMKDSDEK